MVVTHVWEGLLRNVWQEPSQHQAHHPVQFVPMGNGVGLERVARVAIAVLPENSVLMVWLLVALGQQRGNMCLPCALQPQILDSPHALLNQTDLLTSLLHALQDLAWC